MTTEAEYEAVLTGATTELNDDDAETATELFPDGAKEKLAELYAGAEYPDGDDPVLSGATTLLVLLGVELGA